MGKQQNSRKKTPQQKTVTAFRQWAPKEKLYYYFFVALNVSRFSKRQHKIFKEM